MQTIRIVKADIDNSPKFYGKVYDGPHDWLIRRKADGAYRIVDHSIGQRPYATNCKGNRRLFRKAELADCMQEGDEAVLWEDVLREECNTQSNH